MEGFRPQALALAVALCAAAPLAASEASKGLDAFARRFVSESPDVRAGAVEDLSDLDDLEVTKRVANAAFKDAESMVNMAGVNVLSRLKDSKSIDWLLQTPLKSEKMQVRYLTVATLSRLSDPRLADRLLPCLDDPAWLVVATAAQALGEKRASQARDGLVALLGHKDQRVRIAAVDALGLLGDASVQGDLMKLLAADKEWRVKAALCEALCRLKAVDAVPSLRNQLQKAEGRLKDDFSRAVCALVAVEAEAHKGGKPVEGVEAYDFHYEGIGSSSKRVVFLMDCSQSMDVQIGYSAKKVELEEGCESTKLGVCQSELIRALQQLQKTGGMFNIVFVHSQNDIWEKQLVPATPEKVDQAVKHIKRQKASGRTNLCDALLAVLEIQDGGAVDLKPEDLKEAPDTVFVLSDGNPNDGKIKRQSDILEAVREFNRFARARIHGIGTGESGFLEELAKQNGGTFVKKVEF